MKDLLYISHPQINQISAKIVKRKYEDDTTKIILDRSIFMPNSFYLLDENPKISENVLLDVEFINGNLVHTIKNKPQKSSVILSLDKNTREKNLSYNTAFYIFKSLFAKFYNNKEVSLKIKNSYGQIKISNFYDDFIADDFLKIFNKIIDLGLKINKDKDFVWINGFEQENNFGVYLNNTKDLEGIFILSIEKIEKNFFIDFITGSDYKNFTNNNIEIINNIKKISFDDLNSSEKIRKIISLIQKSSYK